MTETTEGPDGRAGIDAALVRKLLAAQFPRWAALPVRPVAVDGWDNRTYRLGDDMTVRLPTAPGYVPAVAKEDTWLPVLAPRLPVPVPEVLGRGRPGEGYPYPWSVRRWLPGETATAPERVGGPAALKRLAEDVGCFVLALRGADAAGGPAAGEHSWHRGAPPVYYDEETRGALASLDGSGLVGTARAAEVWQAALDAPYEGPPVWFHGDIAGGNLLVRGGRLAAVLDFGTRRASATRRATSSSPGPSSPARAAPPSAARSGATPACGRGRAAGRCGRRSSASSDSARPTPRWLRSTPGSPGKSSPNTAT